MSTLKKSITSVEKKNRSSKEEIRIFCSRIINREWIFTKYKPTNVDFFSSNFGVRSHGESNPRTLGLRQLALADRATLELHISLLL